MPEIDLVASLQRLSVFLLPALLGIILHEIAHGFVAYRLGDPTAKDAGRLTLNPIPHIDPVGLLVFVITGIAGGFVFGWAKPVPVNARYFSNPSKGMMLVALAGPCTNILLAIIFALILASLMHLQIVANGIVEKIASILFYGVGINIGLACFNLLPIPPLDGSRVIAGILPNQMAYYYFKLERFGLLIVFALLALGILNKILLPVMMFCVHYLLALFGIYI